jgi:molybdopterin-guanine dinucleotide biosynthesis protein A
VAAVVLAGGQSRRFGTDKLAAAIGDRTLLESAIGDLPSDWLVILVGPERVLSSEAISGKSLITVREHPPGGGPAAGLVAGIGTALDRRAEIVVTLPGDAPSGGQAASVLVAAINDGPAVVAIDDQGREQPLQFAARAGAVRRLAARTGVVGMRARDLLADLGPYRRLRLDPGLTADVDTPDDLNRVIEQGATSRP